MDRYSSKEKSVKFRFRFGKREGKMKPPAFSGFGYWGVTAADAWLGLPFAI